MKKLLFLLLFPLAVSAQVTTKTQSATANYTVAGSLASLTNSIAVTTIFSQAIPGGSLGTAKHLHLTLVCRISSTAVNPTMSINLNYGTQTVLVGSGISINASLNNASFVLNADIYANNSTGSQITVAEVRQSAVGGPLASSIYQQVATWTVDSSVAQTLSVTAQFNSALTGTTLIPLLVAMETK